MTLWFYEICETNKCFSPHVDIFPQRAFPQTAHKFTSSYLVQEHRGDEHWVNGIPCNFAGVQRSSVTSGGNLGYLIYQGDIVFYILYIFL